MYQVRDGKQVVPTCPECGCRLGQFEDMWYHFSKSKSFLGDNKDKKDARGCKCSLYRTGLEFGPKRRFSNGNIIRL